MKKKLKKIEEYLHYLDGYIYETYLDSLLYPAKDYKKTDIVKCKSKILYNFRYWVLLFPIEIINTIYYRIFIRGYCAINGCKLHYNDYNLPDGCSEWWCEHCWAEGIDWVVRSWESFDKNTPIRNFIEALKGK